jgi:hypothetical protein
VGEISTLGKALDAAHPAHAAIEAGLEEAYRAAREAYQAALAAETEAVASCLLALVNDGSEEGR